MPTARDGKEIEKRVTYDHLGRMNYHPFYHSRTGKAFTASEIEYLCKYWEVDSPELLSLALERTEKSLYSKVKRLKKNGLYEFYKNRNKYW